MIFADDSAVKVDGILLPGLFKKIEVTGDAIVDEQEVEGQTKKPKQATGYEDVKVNIELVLEDGPELTRHEKLEVIQNIFRRPAQEKPDVHEIVNEHTAIRGVKKVIFKKLHSSRENKRTQLTVTLEFWEYTVINVSAFLSSGKGAKENVADTMSNLNADYQDYLGSRGAAPPDSPAQDTANPLALLQRIGDLPE